jgi:hypothetical protein
MTEALSVALQLMAALILLAVSLGTLSGQSRRERDTHRAWMERNAWERRGRPEGGGGYVARVITLPAVPDRFLSNGGAS